MNKAQWSLQFLIIAIVTELAACTTVEISRSDTTPPVIKMDIHGVIDGQEHYTSLWSDSNSIRRTVGKADKLTLFAWAEDSESGISSAEIVAETIRECQVTQSFPGRGGAPDGPPVGQRTLLQSDIVLAAVRAVTGNARSLREMRFVIAKSRLKDLQSGLCPSIRFFVNDDPPMAVIIAVQSTTFCGVRVFARGKNGVGLAHSTATGLLVEGPPRSGAFPCSSVPF